MRVPPLSRSTHQKTGLLGRFCETQPSSPVLTRPLGWRFGRGDKSSFPKHKWLFHIGLDFLDVFFWLSFEVAERVWTKHYCTIFSCSIQDTHWSKVYIYHSKKHPWLPCSTSSLHDSPIHESPVVLHSVFVSKLELQHTWRLTIDPPKAWYLPEGNFLDKTQSTTSSIKGCLDE